MQGSMQDWVRSRCGIPAGVVYGAAENLEIGPSTLPTFTEPRVSTKTSTRLAPGTVLPLLETREVGSDLWHRVQTAAGGSTWVVGKSDGTLYAYATSEQPREGSQRRTTPNGWPAWKNGEKGDLVTVNVPGVKTPMYVARDAAAALGAMVRWWHQHVGPVRLLGSHNYRVINGTTTLSNHSSGTAVDINGCWAGADGSLPSGCSHPYLKYTVNPRLKPAIRAKAKELGLRWGGDYRKERVDEMHFEVNMDPAAFKRFWAGRAPPSMAPVSSLEEATTSVQSLWPGGQPLTAQARGWTETGTKALPIAVGVGVVVLAGLFLSRPGGR